MIFNNKNNKDNYSHHYYENVQAWYEKTLEIMKELDTTHMNDKDKTLKGKRLLLARLSTQIDIGRKYFGNVVIDEKVSKNKPDIFKGNHVVVLDLLIIFHHVFEEGSQKINEKALRNIERAWISEITKHISENEKKAKISQYTLVDKNKLLSLANFYKKEYREIFNNADIIECVKANNEKTGIALATTEPKTKTPDKVKVKKSITPKGKSGLVVATKS